MRLTIVSFKGGVGKTTTAVHLAALFQNQGPTLLLDGDPNRSATAWAQRGHLPFTVLDETQATHDHVKNFAHVVVDTQARPSAEDLQVLAESSDLLVIPATPDIMSLHALMLTVDTLHALKANRYRVLLSIIPPKPSRDGEEARASLLESKVPMFKGQIRRFAAFAKAALAGVLVQEVPDPRAGFGWEDYQHIGKEIVK